MVLEMTSNKRVDAELLERIMEEVEKGISVSLFSTSIDDQNNQVHLDSSIDPENESTVESGEGRSHETEQLVNFLGKVLQQVHKLSSLFLSLCMDVFFC